MKLELKFEAKVTRVKFYIKPSIFDNIRVALSQNMKVLDHQVQKSNFLTVTEPYKSHNLWL